MTASGPQYDARLEESEARFRGVFEQSAIGMSLTALDGRLLRVNAALCQLLGRTEQQLVDSTFMAHTHPDDVARDVAQKDALVAGTAGSYRMEKRYLHQDGRVVWVDLNVTLVRNAAGEPLHLLAQMQDITARKDAEASQAQETTAHEATEAALRAQQERHELVLKATNDLIYDWNLGTNTIFFSEALFTAFCHARDVPCTEYAWWTAQIHPDDLGPVTSSLERAIADGDEFWAGEYRFRRGDGSYATVLDRGHLVRDAAGAPVRMIGSMLDVSDRRQLEAQLRESQKMEAVGRLAGGVAHDFNNLLSAILGYTDLALMDLSDRDTVREELEEIRKAGQRAAQLTGQLLAFGRRQIRRPRHVDVHAVVRDTGRLLTQLLGERIQLLAHPAEGEAIVHIDPSELDQILVNLAVNARDAMPDGGTVTIETARVLLPSTSPSGVQCAPGAPHVLLTVADTGSGIAPEVLPNIFEPFFTTKGESGTGLGLSTVYGIVQQNGGRIEVESVVGEGTRFLVHLPAHDGPLAATDGPAVPAPAPREGSTVLLVEDETGVRTLARRILERAGFRVLEARHGGDALLLWRQHADAIDVVVTDLVMPEMGGRELAAVLHETHTRIPILYMSGYSDDEVTRRGFADERIAFLAKPFTAEGLVGAVRDALRDALRRAEP